jgi:hypothetical protein
MQPLMPVEGVCDKPFWNRRSSCGSAKISTSSIDDDASRISSRTCSQRPDARFEWAVLPFLPISLGNRLESTGSESHLRIPFVWDTTMAIQGAHASLLASCARV